MKRIGFAMPKPKRGPRIHHAGQLKPHHTMTTQTTPKTYGLQYWITQTMQTRQWGHTYVHTGARSQAPFAFRAFEHNGITFSFCSWGRSLTTAKGHKYKVYARYADSGKPVPAKVLKNLF